MPWYSLINLTISKITPTLMIPVNDLSFIFKHNKYESEINVKLNY